jgi:NAD(P)-dependent dehydrogenase (short-subunit alcohol dehydrogenase family)
MDTVLALGGGLDALVNNAGVGSVGSMEETTDEDAHRIFEVNLFGPLRLARLAIPVMRAAGAGHIVNVTSINDTLSAPFGGWYSASKAALASATSVLAAEVRAFGIAVTIVAPGLFRTDMAAALGDQRPDPNSPYRPALEALRAQDVDRYTRAEDPDQVAEAIATCLANPHPPARLVVGIDAVNFEKLVRESTPDAFAQMLQDYVAQLTEAGRAKDA